MNMGMRALHPYCILSKYPTMSSVEELTLLEIIIKSTGKNFASL